MKHKYRTFYFTSLTILLVASAYPLYMGAKTLLIYFQNGVIEIADYPKYVIPYAPMCIAILFSTALLPLLHKHAKKYSLLGGSGLAVVLFFAAEIGFEQMKVIEGYKALPLQSWQYSLCVATPEVLKAIGEPIYAVNNPAFKIHFYLIAIIIILTVTGVIYGFTGMIKENDTSRKKPLITQAFCVGTFISLCVLACFTSFYRNGTIHISPLSSFLMSLFFIMFGITFGVYFACLFFGKSQWVSVLLPSVIATLTTIIMYFGELVLMNGILFKLGRGIFFEPLGVVPFAPFDILIILLSGFITWGVSSLLNENSGNQITQDI